MKKPLMTKVSLRHLNEIVRERNQYSRDATEAWQDFINLKGRMDTELTKVNKRNNFLVEELESWKQQFEKFQAFASQLTKEAQELKAKIETHKRENRRLTALIDQQKDDSARLTLRLSSTEKQRDDALEALMMQQEVAEELERERKKNKKEISALQAHNQSILRQRDEAQRVVLHLRSLIEGQAHHMEHIVKSLSDTPEISQYIEEEYDDDEDEQTVTTAKQTPTQSRAPSRSTNLSRASTIDGKPMDGEDVSEDMESRFFNNSARSSRRYSQMSVADVADRHLRDKTDAIAHIIRNISEQCARAVDNLQLARNAAHEDDRENDQKRGTVIEDADAEDGQEVLLSPREGVTSIPPTPDLIHRSSTALSMISTRSPDRNSMQYGDIDVPTKIVEVDDTEIALNGHGQEDEGMYPRSQTTRSSADTARV